ncbi:MAG: S58 family peptidase, partial [Gammaproteobacteria bacterium]|nr:S58 family peptidase [Gammaproteobacteria bacterium]
MKLAPILITISLTSLTAAAADNERPRARDVGVVVGVFEPGINNAITDVSNVRVGHATVVRGDDIRT